MNATLNTTRESASATRSIYSSLKQLEDGGVGVLDKHLGVLVEPLASLRGAGHAALAVALTTGLDPHEGIDDGVVGLGGGSRAEAGGLDIAPLAPIQQVSGQKKQG